MTAVVPAHIAATWAMVGFIWTIEVLQYPMEVSQGLVAAERRGDRPVVGRQFSDSNAVHAWSSVASGSEPEGCDARRRLN